MLMMVEWIGVDVVNQMLAMTMDGTGTITGLQKNQLVMITRRCVRWRKTSR